MSRDSGGTYTLPGAVNPVVAGTTITDTWGNTTLNDVGTALTDSLSRSGKGGMTAPLKLADGTVLLPALAFSNESTSGFYRAGTGDVRMTMLGVDLVAYTASNITVTVSNVTVTGALFASTAGSNINTTQVPTTAWVNTWYAPLASPTFTGTVVLPAATSIGTVSAAEILTLDGVTSGIQAQLDLKAPLASPTFTGTVTVPSPSNPTDAVTKSYADALSVAAGNVPIGGSTNQVLKKNSASNYDMSWGTIDIAGGAAITSSAIDVTLTSASGRVQSLAMTASGKTVTLPDATTLNKGGALFVIKNTGALNYAVRASGGGFLVGLTPGLIAVFYLTDNTTAAGTWVLGDESAGTAFNTPLIGPVTTLNAVSSTFMSIIALSSTVSVAAYSNGTNLVARVLTITGSAISAGTEIIAGTNGQYVSLTRLTSTTALILFSEAAVGTYPTAVVLTVSGASLSAGTALTVSSAASSSSNWVSANSATVALSVYRGASGYPCAKVLSISGTTITAGAELVINALASDYVSVLALTATTGIGVYRGTSGYIYGVVLTISGTSVTAGAALTIASVINSAGALSTLTSTTALVAYTNNSSGFIESRVLTVSGTTLTTSASTSLGYASTTPALAPLTEGGWLGHLDPSNYPSVVKATVASGVASFGSRLNIASASTTTFGITTQSANSLVMLYRGTSNYAQAVVLEYPS